MRSRGLSFADAVRLLDGDAELVTRAGSAAGAAAGVVTVASAGTVDFFALRDQVVSWGHAAVRAWRNKVRGLSRFDRTDRLVAAHTVIVLVSFYEALDAWFEAHGMQLDAAGISAAEQAAIAAGEPVTGSYDSMVAQLAHAHAPCPTPLHPAESLEQDVETYCRQMAAFVVQFLSGMRLFEGKDLRPGLEEIGADSIRRYREAYRRLAAEIPEFRLWTQDFDARATRELIREASAERHAATDAVRDGLVRIYEARMDKPILSAADAPDLNLPTLRDGYQEPAGHVAIANPGSLVATERWWAEESRRLPAVQDFLIAVLTTPEATDRPIVVLGQPGSGKSVLTRVLAARLATAGFLPVRVELRNVRADAPVQQQIQEALELQLGESVTWPELIRRAGPALPVVMMDGFDELLQATGQNWAGYLEQLQDFQQREAELGRPLAIVVTSRTVVADRARIPEKTTVVRLDQFGDEQIAAWLRVWNGLNAPGLAARGLRTLPVEAAIAHRELAEQPLLLLLLAIYDSRGNQLQDTGGGLGRVELYERIFKDFFERQVDKFGGDLGPEQWDAEVAAEWRRLSAVAIAMHNRGRDVILEPELDEDARQLLSAEDRTTAASTRPLGVGQLLVGRFFFVHESQASRDTGGVERSFEFLHATFAEFLAARQIVSAMTELAEDRARLRRRQGATLDAGFFHALTSFAVITRRAPLWEFCQGLIARLDPGTRERSRALVLELLADAGYPHPTWSLAAYEPERRTAAQRQAAFAANLTCLAVLLTDGPVDAAELVGEPVAVNWRRFALLCLAQLEPEDARRLWQSLRVCWELGSPARLTVRTEDGTDVWVFPSLPWPPEDAPRGGPRPDDVAVPAESPTGHLIRKSAFAQTCIDARELAYTLIPFWRAIGDISFQPTVYLAEDKWRSDVRDLLELLLEDPGPESITDIEPGRQALYREYLDRAQATLSEMAG
ncbi:NACHT domain-containing protein [Paractinoplanes globisporus]|uniref:NACHT domain-containing protein n=1 Tax=Paractinoplanes globisporus TaxID=113565 RepID=A0ABW6WT58_9ACTN|nr:NACHT domain-containing protein [Actinoplanes globisporus]